MAVESVLNQLAIEYHKVDIGRIILKNDLQASDKSKLRSALLYYDLDMWLIGDPPNLEG